LGTLTVELKKTRPYQLGRTQAKVQKGFKARLNSFFRRFNRSSVVPLQHERPASKFKLFKPGKRARAEAKPSRPSKPRKEASEKAKKESRKGTKKESKKKRQ
jgi:hypothetical protein